MRHNLKIIKENFMNRIRFTSPAPQSGRPEENARRAGFCVWRFSANTKPKDQVNI